MDDKKTSRVRVSIFTAYEKALLVQLIKKRPIIVSKHTDNKTVQKKRMAWSSVTEEFNSNAHTTHKRDTGTLKKVWDNLKVRKKRTTEYGSLVKSEDGPTNTPDIPQQEDISTVKERKMTDFRWDECAALLLIEKFHECELLWNTKNKDYKNRIKRKDALKSIASVFEINWWEVERKLKNLSCHFFREHKKFENSKKTGRDDIQTPKWFAYQALTFLKDKHKPDSTLDSEEDNSVALDDNDRSSQTGNKSTLKRKLDPDPDITCRNCKSSEKSLQLLRDKSKKRNDIDVFAEFIACKLKKMDNYTVSSVQNQIQNIIFNAEMSMFSSNSGYFTQPSTSMPSSSPSYSVKVDDYVEDSPNNDSSESLESVLEQKGK